jgi:hypothetical protein
MSEPRVLLQTIFINAFERCLELESQVQGQPAEIRGELVRHLETFKTTLELASKDICPFSVKACGRRGRKSRQPRLTWKSGRRELDEDMEIQLHREILEEVRGGSRPTDESVRRRALALTSYPQFKGSKGWLERFYRRYQLGEAFSQVDKA